MHKLYKSSTLLLIGAEGYSTPAGKRDRRDPEANTMLVTKALSQDVTYLAFVPLAEEAARRSPTGKRVAWNGNQPHVLTAGHKHTKIENYPNFLLAIELLFIYTKFTVIGRGLCTS
ncbi:hypothetical protein [Lysinibacillus sp. TE18511]